MSAYCLVFCISFLYVVECQRHFGFFQFPLKKIQSKINFEEVIEKINTYRSTWKADTKSLLEIPRKSLTRLLGEVDLKDDILPFKEKRKYQHIDKIPEVFDARKQWPNCPSIRQIRDQGVCGSCWAVATSSAFSDRACISGLTRAPLSELEVLSCCEDCGQGCTGGNSQLAWNYFLSFGLVTGGLYNTSQGCQPYEIESCERRPNVRGQLTSCSELADTETPACQRRCTNPDYPIPYENDIQKAYNFAQKSLNKGYKNIKLRNYACKMMSLTTGGIKGFQTGPQHLNQVEVAYILRNNVTDIQLEIMTHGPVGASMVIYTDFYTYQSGIYQHLAGDRMGSHAVRLIGWGRENGTDFWLAANSWNSGWGEEGLFRILRGSNECGIEKKVTAGLPHNPK